MNKQTIPTTGEQVADYLSDARATAADAIEGVKERAGEAVSNLSGGVANVTSKAKAQFDNAAAYVREFDVNAVVDDAKRYAQANPVPVLLGALAIGFMAGRMLRRD